MLRLESWWSKGLTFEIIVQISKAVDCVLTFGKKMPSSHSEQDFPHRRRQPIIWPTFPEIATPDPPPLLPNQPISKFYTLTFLISQTSFLFVDTILISQTSILFVLRICSYLFINLCDTKANGYFNTLSFLAFFTITCWHPKIQMQLFRCYICFVEYRYARGNAVALTHPIGYYGTRTSQ